MKNDIRDLWSVFGNVLLVRIEDATCMKCGHYNLIRWRVGYKEEPTRPDAKCERCSESLPPKVNK